MKVQWLLPGTLLMSVALMGIIKMRKSEHDKYDKQRKFQDIRLRVAYDVLAEYENEKTQKQKLTEKTNTDQKALEEEVNAVKINADKAKGDVDVCQANKKTVADELGAVKAELNNLKAEQEKEKTSWKAEEEALKQKLASRSSVCEFIKKDSAEARKLCGIQEEPKVEAPKQEEAKAEAPKQEEAKAEAPKQEGKAEAPKQEEAKAEAPKQEEAKAEAPKQEEGKAEAPKQEEAKAEAPKS